MKKWMLAAAGSILILSCTAQDFAKQIENNNQFGFDLYKYVNQPDDNLFISPFSISTALAMTYEGAAGKSKEEMMKYLRFSSDKKENLTNFGDILSRVENTKDENKYFLRVANSLWAQNDFKFLQSYFEIVKNYYDSPIEKVDYKDPENREKARLAINDWTAKKTNDKIKDLLGKDVLDFDTKLVLVNAVYFLSEWKKAFDLKATRVDTFFAQDTVIEKEFMHTKSRMRYIEKDGLKILEIPYFEDKASMFIYMPSDANHFKTLQKEFDFNVFKSLCDSMQSENIYLSLPKFKIEYKADLAETLFKAGMKHPFTDDADFSDMVCDEDVKIDKIIHQTFINVDESGTEAAAATAVVMSRVTSVNPDELIEFNANRPFIFLIRENTTGSILFIGHLVK
jgi:serpin B